MIRRRAISLLVAALTLTLPAGLAGAEDGQPTPEVTAGATAVDLLVARPGGLAATVLGTVIFVVGLPFTLINGSTEQAAQQLIGDPASYTFARPLGQDLGGLGHPQQ
jgi:hypothetical protein